MLQSLTDLAYVEFYPYLKFLRCNFTDSLFSFKKTYMKGVRQTLRPSQHTRAELIAL